MRKTYGSGRRSVLALDGVNLAVEPGAFASVLGPSGSGKTTLLRCIAGFETPDAGTIQLAGRDLDAPGVTVRPYERGIGIVPQEGALFPHLSVAQNIGFGLARRPKRQRRHRVAELLDLVGLRGFDDRRPHQLSGGQQQRVALARALAPAPQLILLDEPFSAIDAQLRVELREEIRTLLRQLRTTALLVTHDQAEAMTLADHLVVMRQGQVVAAGDPRQIYSAPSDLELGRFLGEAVVLPGVIEPQGDRLAVCCALGRLDVASAGAAVGECSVLVRPEQLSARPVTEVSSDRTAAGHAGAPAFSTFRRPSTASTAGVVVGQSFFGHDALVRVRLEAGPLVSVLVQGSERYDLGEPIAVGVHSAVATYASNGSVPRIDPG